MSRYCEDCGCAIGKHGCENCNEESYIVDQYYEQNMTLPNDNTDFMKKYYEQLNKNNKL